MRCSSESTNIEDIQENLLEILNKIQFHGYREIDGILYYGTIYDMKLVLNHLSEDWQFIF